MRVSLFLLTFLGLLDFGTGDAQRYRLGVIPADSASYSSLQQTKSSLSLSSVTSIIEDNPIRTLRDYFPTPGNQGNYGTCVAWALSYLKSFQEAIETSSSPKMMSPAFIYNQIGNAQCDGASIFTGLSLLSDKGSVQEKDFPYIPSICKLNIGSKLLEAAKTNRIVSFERLPDNKSSSQIIIKSKILTMTPVVISVKVYPSFMDYKGGIYKLKESDKSVLGLHAVVIIGFDEKKQSFEIINSWGEQWGERGYAYISYDSLFKILNEGYVASDLVIQVRKPQQAVTKFTWTYNFDPEPGLRVWNSIDGIIWVESFPSGFKKFFEFSRREKIDGISGAVVTLANTKDEEVFIPDRGNNTPWLLFKFSNENQWRLLGKIDYQ